MKMVRHFLKFVLFLTVSGSFYAIFADGILTVRTDPDGIEIWLDDNFVGDSPIIDKKLKSGRYTLKMVDPVQHSSTIEEIFVQEGETTVIEKTLKSKFGSLKVSSDPEGATVSIATELGKTPVSNNFMNPGKYRVEIRYPNKRYHSASEDIVIPRGETVSLSKTLEQEKRFDKKDFWRLMLGAGTAGGYVWAIVQQGNHTKFDEQYKSNELLNSSAKGKADGALAQTIIGTIVGSLCLVGLEIVAFF